MSSQMVDKRSPLETAEAIAERFMKIAPPVPPTYMYNIGVSGILDLWEATQEQRYLDFYLAHHEKHGPQFDWPLYTATGDSRWIEGAEEIAEKFLANPQRDREGALVDGRGRYTIDIFSGQLTMPIIYGHLLNDHRYFDEAAWLFEVYRGYLEHSETGVWYSRWGHSMHPNRPNPGLWARGNGWLAAAWGRTMQLWDPAHPGYEKVLQGWQHFCRSIAAFQKPSGLFRQLLNRDDSFEDATGSGLFCTAFAFGVRHGTLPEEFGPIAYRDFCGLRGLIDEKGNIHNVSTYGGGYNFEKQYYSCARLNDPHGDGTVMSGCVAVHMLLKENATIDTTEPTQPPTVITEPVPGMLSNVPVERREAEDIAAPVLERALALDNVPETDLYGSTILGVLHWYDYVKDESLIARGSELLERFREGLSPKVRWNLAAEISLRTGERDGLEGLGAFVDAELAGAARDRNGVFLDEEGGYTIGQLYVWLPLLAKAGAASGEFRYFDEACAQLVGHQRWLEDPLTHLWFSAFGHGAHPRRVTPGLWGLGNGYCLGGMVGLLEHLPRDHDGYVDVVHLLRCHFAALHQHEVASGGWTQLLENFKSFPCTAGTALITYGCARALLNGWVHPEYYAAAAGGLHNLSGLVDREGNLGFCSRPAGGLDTLAAYEQHRLENDPGTLGFVLSACAYAGQCARAEVNPDDRDESLGAR